MNDDGLITHAIHYSVSEATNKSSIFTEIIVIFTDEVQPSLPIHNGEGVLGGTHRSGGG